MVVDTVEEMVEEAPIVDEIVADIDFLKVQKGEIADTVVNVDQKVAKVVDTVVMVLAEMEVDIEEEVVEARVEVIEMMIVHAHLDHHVVMEVDIMEDRLVVNSEKRGKLFPLFFIGFHSIIFYNQRVLPPVMQFSYPLILIGLPLICSIWWIFFREKIGYIAPNPLLRVHSQVPWSFRFLWLTRGMILVLLFFILSGPSITSHEKVLQNTGKNIVLVLDVSKSMLAEDIAPNRITRAKNVLHTFLTHPSGDQFSYIVFAGKPFLLSPATNDLAALQRMVDASGPDLIKQELPGLSGTNIGDALLLASSLIG